MDIELILHKLSEAGYIRLHRIIGNYYQIYCPFHNDGNERKPSCGVLLSDEYRNGQLYKAGWFHCFSCSYTGSLIQSLHKLFISRSVSQSVEDWLLENVPEYVSDTGYEPLVGNDMIKILENKYAVSMLEQSKPSYVPESELERYRFTVPYMYERKLTDKVIADYDVGFDRDWVPPGRKHAVPCITFPVRDKFGNTLFLCRRSVQGKLFNYPTGVTKPVYGIDKIPPDATSLIVCESCFNALTAVVYGYNAVALLGTGNAYQIQQLRELGVSEYVICMDGDDAGKRATAKLQRQLRDVGIVWTINMPPGKDINDCTKAEFDSLYNMKE